MLSFHLAPPLLVKVKDPTGVPQEEANMARCMLNVWFRLLAPYEEVLRGTPLDPLWPDG